MRMHKMFKDSFDDLAEVDLDMKEALWLYMCHGIEPGSFGMAVLQNDFMTAALMAHPALPASVFKGIAQWLKFMAPNRSWGSEAEVKYWKSLSDEQRRDLMIECELRPSVIQILKGEQVA